MVPFKLLVWSLTFYYLIVDLDAKGCPKGQGNEAGVCKICHDGYYQSEENFSKRCKPCTKCDENSGSVIEQKCTKETDTICRCVADFVPVESDSATCECSRGFGLKKGDTDRSQKVCSRCAHGYFSSRPNSPCQKWKECKSGVSVNGSSTSDVSCNKELDLYITTPPTSDKHLSLITRMESLKPHEGARTLEKPQRGPTSSTRDVTWHAVTSKDKVQPPNSNNHLGMIFLILGIVGLLGLTAVTCKLNISPLVKRHPAVRTSDSCRRPVEESGDGSLTSLKPNSEEP